MEVVEIGGVEHKFSGFTQQIQKEFEDYISNEALRLIKQNSSSFSDVDNVIFKHLLSVKAGEYKFRASKFYDMLAVADHLAKLLYFCYDKQTDLFEPDIKKWVNDNRSDAVEFYNKLEESVVDVEFKKKDLTTSNTDS